MKTKLLLFFTLLQFSLLFVSCANIEYESDDRIVFEGYIKRQDGSPIPNIPIYTYVFLNEGGSSDSDYISYTTTENDGHYVMVFPKPTNHSYIKVLINSDVSFDTPLSRNSALTDFTIENILPDDLSPLHLNFGTTQLYGTGEVTTLRINLVTDGQPQTTLLADYEGLFPQYSSYFTEPEYSEYLDPDYPDPGTPTADGLYTYWFTQIDQTTSTRLTSVLKNQTVVFRYLNAAGVITNVNMPVADEPVTYTINY